MKPNHLIRNGLIIEATASGNYSWIDSLPFASRSIRTLGISASASISAPRWRLIPKNDQDWFIRLPHEVEKLHAASDPIEVAGDKAHRSVAGSASNRKLRG